jgi:DNA-directed RNA polymerase subunit RPC12/RpoP
MGEILCRKAFGEQGPDLQTSLADLEQLLGPVLERLAAGFLRASVAQQSERLGDELACPTCGRECAAETDLRERRLTTDHGDFRCPEPAYHCDRCGRSFFPAADGAAD